MVNDGLIEPQLAMKALTAFDKAATEVLGEKVKAKLVFKVSGQASHIHYTAAESCVTGLPRHLSLLRRSVDLYHSRSQHQA